MREKHDGKRFNPRDTVLVHILGSERFAIARETFQRTKPYALIEDTRAIGILGLRVQADGLNAMVEQHVQPAREEHSRQSLPPPARAHTHLEDFRTTTLDDAQCLANDLISLPRHLPQRWIVLVTCEKFSIVIGCVAHVEATLRARCVIRLGDTRPNRLELLGMNGTDGDSSWQWRLIEALREPCLHL